MEDFADLAFTQAGDLAFSAQQSVIGKEERQPAEIVEAVAGVRDVECFLNAVDSLPVAELPDGEP